MGKKRTSKFAEDQRKLKKQQQDAQLSIGLANRANELDPYGEDSEEDGRVNSDDEEMDYELRPRSLKQEKAKVGALPIKKGSRIEAVVEESSDEEDGEEDEEEEEEQQEQQEQQLTAEGVEEEEEEEEEEELDTEEKIIALKEEIAELVEKLTEEPEENIGALTRLIKMSQSKNLNTSRFSLLAIVPALKSIIPAYRIRPLTEAEKKEKVSKDVAKLRNFEQTLVLNYRAYINVLTEFAKNSSKDPQMGVIAVKAACELSSSFKHFNYRPDVLIIVIRRICKPSAKNDPVYIQCLKTLEVMLNEDDVGDVSFDIVRLLTKTLRSRKFRVDESALNVFLSLQILSDYDPNATEEEKEERLKIKKKDRVHLSKKERKARKERKAIEEEMRKAEQKVSEEERERFQAEILKMLLKLYLDILRERPDSLMASVLEGLAKIGHMANFDLLGDFLEVFREIIKDSEDYQTREVLLSVATAFALVASHQQYKVNVDLSFFVDSLYSILLDLALDVDVEFSHKTLRLADPLGLENRRPNVNISTRIELLLRGLENIFFRSKNGSKTRALAFNKRLSMALLQTPEKSSIAIMKFLEKLMSRYSELCGAYSTDDRINNGKYIMEANVPARSNAEAATIWETLLLEKHYCPTVSKGAKALMRRANEST
ncbi:NOC3 [Cyberlindnera jadinii]|uniref:Nucleolar complex-associated protein 3 n=1 Tax=Cyberlindnera jadinii (strain ATCC 18201 / CBS 1600 / BCRC 20928 / JCM 3617 / NBRC 0987 / NRRL Y-1542) TaxID=983966 RepID=A0A0H5CKC7_CYBJN|nr:NOC3 [Cyberlindnera jadinii]